MDNRFLLPGIVLFTAIALAMSPPARESIQRITGGAPDKISLPEPKYVGAVSVEESILQRRSVRVFKEDPVSLDELSQLLWAAQGITSPGGLRSAPSAGALYPLELCVVAGNVSGLPAGVYRYKPGGHELSRLATGDKRSDLCNAALGQSSIRRAPMVLVLSAVYERTTTKYGERGIRYVHMEAGHAAQNVYLQATALRLGTVVIGAFSDRDVKSLLKMVGGETPLYIMPVGRK